MRIVHERCCGLNVHKTTVVACLMTPAGTELRTIGTMTSYLRFLRRGSRYGRGVDGTGCRDDQLDSSSLSSPSFVTDLRCSVSPFWVTGVPAQLSDRRVIYRL